MNCNKIARLSITTLALSFGAAGLYAGKMEQQQQGQFEQTTHLAVKPECRPNLSFFEVQREATFHLGKDGHITKEVTTTLSGTQARQICLELPLIERGQDVKLCPDAPCDQKQSKSQCDAVGVGALAEAVTGQSRVVSYDGTAYSRGTFVEYAKQKCNFTGYERGLKVTRELQKCVTADDFFGDVSVDAQNQMITPISDDEIMNSLARLMEDLRANGGTVTYSSSRVVGADCGLAQGSAQSAAQGQAQVQGVAQVQKVAPPVARKGK